MELEALFSEWYSVVDPGFTGGRVKNRLTAAAKIAGSVTPANAVDLATTFYAQDATAEFTSNIRAQIRDADDTYVSHDKAELAVICAGVLYTLFQKSGPTSHACALLLLCGEFGGLRGIERIDAVVVRARQYLVEEGTRVRDHALSFPNLTDLLKPATKKLQTATKEKAAGEPEADVDSSFEIHTDTLKALKNFGTSLIQSLELLESRRLEESSVLYWLLGGRALESEEPFSKIEKPLLAFIAAHDLASQTQQLPGPASCRPILKSVLALGKGAVQQASTETCLSKISSSDGQRLLVHAKVLSPIFMPLTFALEKAHEVDWNTGWESAFTAQTKLKTNANRPIDEISEQFYRELLLSRLLRGA
jgi:GTPase-associated system helical domain